MPPLLGKPYETLPEGGPSFQTGAFGGPEGLSPQMMALWHMARGMQQDPFGGLAPQAATGIVRGPGAQNLLNLLPARLGQFVERMPETLLASAPKDIKGALGSFTPASDLAQRVGILGNVGVGTKEGADTAVHEVLHALYSRKYPDIGGNIPNRFAAPIFRDSALRDPTLHDFALKYLDRWNQPRDAIREAAIEALARNVMRRSPK